MDNITIFSTSEKNNNKKQKIFIQTTWIYSQDVQMEFATEKCAMLIMKKEKKSQRKITERIELPNHESIRTVKKENYWYLEFKANTIKQMEMKEKSKKGISKKNKKKKDPNLCRKKSHQRNKYLDSPHSKILWTILQMDK